MPKPYPIGRKIVAMRQLTGDELADEGWELDAGQQVVVLVLDDGSCLYPSRDYEGNGPGAIFCKNKTGDTSSFLSWQPVETTTGDRDVHRSR